jgi:hypothetical protein
MAIVEAPIIAVIREIILPYLLFIVSKNPEGVTLELKL